MFLHRVISAFKKKSFAFCLVGPWQTKLACAGKSGLPSKRDIAGKLVLRDGNFCRSDACWRMQNLPGPFADPNQQGSWAKSFAFAAGTLIYQVLGGSCFPHREVPPTIRRECVGAFRRGVEGQSTPSLVEAPREREGSRPRWSSYFWRFLSQTREKGLQIWRYRFE